jgi:hypothetical protein
MKKTLFIIFIVAVIMAAWLLFVKQKQQTNLADTPQTSQSVSMDTPTNPATNATVAIVGVPSVVATTNNAPLLNVINAQTLDEWKAAVPKLSFQMDSVWGMVQLPTNPALPFIIGSVPFSSDSISVFSRRDNSGNVRRVEIQSLVMNIADTRALGDSLLQMMGKDETAFNAWCDKAGKDGVDTPTFDSAGAHLANGKVCAFSTLCGFNDEKPWIINFVITDP